MAVLRWLKSAFVDIIRPNAETKIDAQKFVFTDLQIELGEGNVIRYNTTATQYEVWLGGEWVPFPGSGGDAEPWREPTHTGVIYGGLVTIESPTQVRIAAGKGWIINAYNPGTIESPVVQTVNWVEQVLTTNFLGEIGFAAIYIDGTGTAFTLPAGSPTARRENIGVGVGWYTAGGLDELYDIPSLVNNTGLDFRDFVAYVPLEDRVKGAEINPVDNEVQVWSNPGQVFILGSNYKNDNTNPNISTIPQYGNATTPLTFDVVLSDGTIHATNQTTIPEYYDDGDGTVSNLGNNRATIFYLFGILGGHFYLQPSQIQYDSGVEARENLVSDYAALVANPYSVYMIPRAQIWRRDGAPDFTDPDEAGINNGFGGNASGSSGEGSTDYINAASFAPATGELQLTGVGLAGATVNLDGRYAQGDELVKTKVGDDAAGYLSAKLLAGPGIGITEIDEAGNYHMLLSAALDYKIIVVKSEAELVQAVTDLSGTDGGMILISGVITLTQHHSFNLANIIIDSLSGSIDFGGNTTPGTGYIITITAGRPSFRNLSLKQGTGMVPTQHVPLFIMDGATILTFVNCSFANVVPLVEGPQNTYNIDIYPSSGNYCYLNFSGCAVQTEGGNADTYQGFFIYNRLDTANFGVHVNAQEQDIWASNTSLGYMLGSVTPAGGARIFHSDLSPVVLINSGWTISNDINDKGARVPLAGDNVIIDRDGVLYKTDVNDLGGGFTQDKAAVDYNDHQGRIGRRLHFVDLNTVVQAGNYYCTGSGDNVPEAESGRLAVTQNTVAAPPPPSIAEVIQTYFSVTGNIWQRSQNTAGTWTAWVQLNAGGGGTDEKVAYVEGDTPGFLSEKVTSGNNISFASGTGPSGDELIINAENVADTSTSPNNIKNLWVGTQAAYDGLTPDANTIYFII